MVGEHVFPFLRTVGGDGSTYAQHMKDAPLHLPDAGPAVQGGGLAVISFTALEARAQSSVASH